MSLIFQDHELCGSLHVDGRALAIIPRLTWPDMGEHQILIASNRGPVSFALSDDAGLTARRNG